MIRSMRIPFQTRALLLGLAWIAAPQLSVALVEDIEAQAVTWEEIADRCERDDAPEQAAAGYLVTLTLEGESYRLFVNRDLAILCGVEDMSEKTPAIDPADAELQRLADEARQDLAARLSLPASRIALRDASRVVWRDGSIGCPEPDKMYPQVLVEGARIVFSVAGRTHVYHQAAGGSPFLCESPAAIEPLPAHAIE